MNIRTTPNPVIRWTGRRLETLNARHPWSHNHHFHPWILRSLPPRPERVLDVGCGRGDLVAALATRAGQVDGIDPDQEMAYATASRFHEEPTVRVRRRTLAEHAAEQDVDGVYDAITMVASLHHMDLPQALADARALLRPGGRLLVVTLTVPRSAVDQVWDVANALTNPLIGVVKHPRPVRDPGEGLLTPVKEPDFSLDDLRRIAEQVLPGASIRRREGFRVTLRWQKPAERAAAA